MTSPSIYGDSSEDANLVRKSLGGDEEAFQEIVVKYRFRIFNICRSVVSDPGDAEDVLQEVFIKLFKNLKRVKDPSRLRSWLYSVALNQARSFLRWKKARSYLTLGLAFEPTSKDTHDLPYSLEFSPQDRAEEVQTALVLSRLTGTLPESLRTPFILKHSDSLPENEIAHILNLSLNAVKIRISRARKMLWEAYQKNDTDHETE